MTERQRDEKPKPSPNFLTGPTRCAIMQRMLLPYIEQHGSVPADLQPAVSAIVRKVDVSDEGDATTYIDCQNVECRNRIPLRQETVTAEELARCAAAKEQLRSERRYYTMGGRNDMMG